MELSVFYRVQLEKKFYGIGSNESFIIIYHRQTELSI